jgi:predicted ATP-dependent protease
LIIYRAYQQDIIENVDLIVNSQELEPDAVASVSSDNAIPSRYQFNVIVSNNPKKGAPVVFEDLPTHYNLMGHVEQVTYMGTVATDFTLIRAGALHRANGGYLLLEAEQVLRAALRMARFKTCFAFAFVKIIVFRTNVDLNRHYFFRA